MHLILLVSIIHARKLVCYKLSRTVGQFGGLSQWAFNDFFKVNWNDKNDKCAHVAGFILLPTSQL